MIVKAIGITSEEVCPAGPALKVSSATPPRPPEREQLSCLVLSTDRKARDRLRVACAGDPRLTCTAPASGTEVASIARAGRRSLREKGRELVFVDLPSLYGEWLSGAVDIVESKAGRRDTLVVVCGHEDDAAEEIVVRQLGAGLYLPGVSLVDAVNHVMAALEREHVAPPARIPATTCR